MRYGLPAGLILFFLCTWFISYGQNAAKLFSDDHDTVYIDSYKNQLTTRIYASKKYTQLKIRDIDKGATLNYNPNDRTNLGFGATYGAFTLNIGINFPFINHDDDEFGKTDYLDLQSHILFRKLAAEVYYSTTKGYYISNPDKILSGYKDSDKYPQRRDFLSIDLGATAYYIFNHQRFSYRAAFNQDERQKKSAGSFLAGAAVFNTAFQGDSVLIPYNVDPADFFGSVRLKRSRFANASICGGYAYNLIFLKRVFITASLIAGPGIGYTKIYTEEDDVNGMKSYEFAFVYTARMGAGYNGKRVYVGLSYVNTNVRSGTAVPDTRYIFNRGNIRINIAYRIIL